MKFRYLNVMTVLTLALISGSIGADAKHSIPVFGTDQTIVNINKIAWSPLKVNGLRPGAEIAVLRGDMKTGTSESLLRLPPNYVVPYHSHTSDELYVWIKGAFTLITKNGTATEFGGSAYISLPGNAPPHGLRCGPKQECIVYLRYSRPFDIQYSVGP